MNFPSKITSGESKNVEFKSSFNQETIEAVGAFANKCGGTIFIGLKSSSNVTGLQLAEESVQKWINEIKSKTEPVQVPDFETFKYKGKTLVAITVKECPIKPVAVQGRYFIIDIRGRDAFCQGLAHEYCSADGFFPISNDYQGQG